MTDTSKKAHYNAEALAHTRYFVKTDEHIFELPWWTTRFHHCKSLIESKASFPHHVVDAVDLTRLIAADMTDNGREAVVLGRLGVFQATPSAAFASAGGNTGPLFHEVCHWLGGKPGWVNAWFVGSDGEPNWITEQHEDLSQDMGGTRPAVEART